MMGREIIKVKNVTYRYREDRDERPALQNVSFSVNEGEWLAIVGHNGSGKSTLARILNGLLLPESGTVEVLRIPLNKKNVWDIRKKVGMVFQNPDNQFVGTTVRDDIAFGLENIGISREEMKRRIEWTTEKVNIKNFLDSEPHHLSGGQKQRVAIASVLAVQPKIIVLDEATSMLDPLGRKEVLSIMKELNIQGLVTIISITHDLDEAANANRIIVMNNGSIFTEGRPEEIFKLDDQLTKIGLDLPFPYKLSKKLSEIGISLQRHHLSEESLVDELCTLKWKT